MESDGMSEMIGKNLDEIDVNDLINDHEQEDNEDMNINGQNNCKLKFGPNV